MSPHPADIRATRVDLELWAWPCRWCGKPRGDHPVEGERYRCDYRGFEFYMPAPRPVAIGPDGYYVTA
jgi:hypothetical protein